MAKIIFVKAKQWVFVGMASLFVGAVNGLVGGGGGMLAVPMFVLLGGFPQKKAHASAVLVMLICSVASSVIYFNKATSDVKTLLWVVGGSLVGAAIGAFLLKFSKNAVVEFLFVGLVAAAGVMMLIK